MEWDGLWNGDGLCYYLRIPGSWDLGTSNDLATYGEPPGGSTSTNQPLVCCGVYVYTVKNKVRMRFWLRVMVARLAPPRQTHSN